MSDSWPDWAHACLVVGGTLLFLLVMLGVSWLLRRTRRRRRRRGARYRDMEGVGLGQKGEEQSSGDEI